MKQVGSYATWQAKKLSFKGGEASIRSHRPRYASWLHQDWISTCPLGALSLTLLGYTPTL